MEKFEYSAINIHFEIQEEVIDLNFCWNSFNQLFRSENTSLAFRLSPVFFMDLRRILQKNIITSIARLFDAKDYLTFHNIGFRLLADQMSEEGIITIEKKHEFTKRIDLFKQEYSAVFKFRNKLIAHNDLDTFRDEDLRQELNQVFTCTEFDNAIDCISTLTNDFVPCFYKSVPESVLLRNHIYLLNFKGIDTDAGKMISALGHEK